MPGEVRREEPGWGTHQNGGLRLRWLDDSEPTRLKPEVFDWVEEEVDQYAVLAEALQNRRGRQDHVPPLLVS